MTRRNYDAKIAEANSLGPSRGQHTHEILREIGRDDAAIAALRAEGVVRCA